MSLPDDIWELERRCWIEGRSFYEEIITVDSVYAFPPPMGIFKGSGFVSQMNEDGPCVSVEFSNQHAHELNGSWVLVYEGLGASSDGSHRRSNCSSVWKRTSDGWKLVAHHQTPITDA